MSSVSFQLDIAEIDPPGSARGSDHPVPDSAPRKPFPGYLNLLAVHQFVHHRGTCQGFIPDSKVIGHHTPLTAKVHKMLGWLLLPGTGQRSSHGCGGGGGRCRPGFTRERVARGLSAGVGKPPGEPAFPARISEPPHFAQAGR